MIRSHNMLGTLSLVAIFICGYLLTPIWVLLPFTILNAFIGTHFPSGKAELLRERNQFWAVFWDSIPLQAIFVGILYGIGLGIRSLVS